MTEIIDGPTIRKMRRALCMTQQELAEKLDVTQAMVSRWERGTEELPRARAVELRDFLINRGDVLDPIVQRLCRWNRDLSVFKRDRTLLRLGQQTSTTFRLQPSEAVGKSILGPWKPPSEQPTWPSVLNPDCDLVVETLYTCVEGDAVGRDTGGNLVAARLWAVTYSVLSHEHDGVVITYPARIGTATGEPARVNTLLPREALG